jgi:hypothetical protein
VAKFLLFLAVIAVIYFVWSAPPIGAASRRRARATEAMVRARIAVFISPVRSR